MTKAIAMFMFPGAQSLDITGPMEVFALANRQAMDDKTAREPLYTLHFVAREQGAVPMASGMRLYADHACANLTGPIDTVLVSGGMGDALDRAREDIESLDWLRAMSRQVRRIGSVCSGALLLAEAGTLDGRQATTHWLDVPELRRRYPGTDVVPDAIYTRDGEVWTSAGITAGMDMALAMVAADHGLPLALKVAKRMVMVTKRSGGQTQFSDMLAAQSVPDGFARLQSWLADNRRRAIGVDEMAQYVNMSPRNFRRRFVDAFDTTPQKYLEMLRIEAAKSMLEHSAHGLASVANAAGFPSAESMRRAFMRRLGIAPADYRERFAPCARPLAA